MFKRLLGRKGKEEEDESKATKAHMGVQSTMYYDKEKKKWRERGKENDEEDDAPPPPPPMAKAKPAEPEEASEKAGDTADGDKDDKKADAPPPMGGGPPKAGSGGVDSLIAPPNPYGRMLGGRGRGAPKTSAPKAPMAPLGGTGFGGAATSQSNPFAPKKFQGGEGSGDAPAPAANPFAPKAFQAKNPNAPKNFQAARGPFGANGQKCAAEPGPEPGASESDKVEADLDASSPPVDHDKGETEEAKPDARFPPVDADKDGAQQVKEDEPTVAAAPVTPPVLPTDASGSAVLQPTLPAVAEAATPTFASGQPEPETPGAPNFENKASDLLEHKEDEAKMPEVPKLPADAKETPEANGTSMASPRVVPVEAKTGDAAEARAADNRAGSQPFDEVVSVEADASVLEEKEEELRSLREAHRALESQLQVVNTEMKAFKEKHDETILSKTKVHEGEVAELRQTLEEERAKLQANEKRMQEELEKAREAERFKEAALREAQVGKHDADGAQAELQELKSRLAAAEEARKAMEVGKAEVERQLVEAQQAVVVSHSSLSDSPPQHLTQRRGLTASDEDDGGEEFELPDFVWSCGDDKVMQFVQKLLAENASLRRQVEAVQAKPSEMPSLTQSPNRLAAELFDTKECNVERMLAFLHGLGDGDSHQIQPLLSGLVEYQSNADVCTKACQALETLTFTQTQNRREIAKHNGFEAIMGAVDRHQDHDALLRAALGAVWNLTFDDEVVDEVAKANAVERTVQVMQRHLSNADLQGSGCAILLNLAVREQNRSKIVEAGGIRRMVEAMESHPNSEEVLEQGCQALYMLAYHQDLKPLVLEAQGGEAAQIAARCRSSRVQKWGQWLEEVLTS